MSIAMEKSPHRGRITVDEYHRMAEVGLLAPDARVELIEGVIVDMPPMGPRHAGTVRRLTELLTQAVGSRATVSCQLPVGLGAYSEPLPDLALLVRREDFYTRRHPSVEDVLLMIEVSDTTLRRDREGKARLYAKHGIRELWIIDVANARVHVFLDPAEGTYRRVTALEAIDRVEVTLMPGVTVDLSSLL